MDTLTMDRPATSGGAPASSPISASPVPTPVMPAPPVVILGRADLFAKRPLKTSETEIAGWGKVRLASMTAGQHGEITVKHEKDGVLLATVGYMADVVAACLVGPDGERMFPSFEEGGTQVKQLDLPVVLELFKAAAQRSAMTVEAREALGKDSGATPSAGG